MDANGAAILNTLTFFAPENTLLCKFFLYGQECKDETLFVISWDGTHCLNSG
jgi:hypothetical protein